jgi:hypothetical protein
MTTLIAAAESNGAVPPSGEALGDEIAVLAAHIDAATHRLLTCIRAFEASEEWGRQGAMSCAHWLTWRIGLDPGAAREKVRVARALAALPRIDDALRRGVLSYAKARAITRVATAANEEVLLEVALYITGAQLERVCRRYRGAQVEAGAAPPERGLRTIPMGGGMVRIDVVLPADEAALVLEAIERTTAMLREEVRARAGERGRSADERDGAYLPGAGETDGARRSGVDEGDGADTAGADVSAETRERSPSRRPARELPPAPLPAPTRADGMVRMAELVLAGGAASGAAEPVMDAASAGEAPATGTVATGTVATSSSGRYADHHQILVHLDAEPGGASGGLGDGSCLGASLDDGTRLSAEALRRLACDGALVPVTTRDGEPGEVLDVGRRTRAIPTALRRALWVRDAGCRFPGCGSRRFLHGHHVRHWMHGGATAIDNLVLLCGFHHRLVHEEGFRVDAAAAGGVRDAGAFVFRTPTGRRLDPAAGVAPAAADPIEWFDGWNDAHDLRIDAETSFPLWDGQPVRYVEVVDALLSQPD